MADIIRQIRSWAAETLKYWEQVALERILTGGDLSEPGIRQLVSYFLQDAGLEPTPTDRPALSHQNRIVGTPMLAPCSLERIYNLRNVNALPNGQEISFGPQLTLVYGNNGAGKSGYARALASAGFARGDRDVLPNMDVPDARGLPQADLDISVGGTKRTVTWTKGSVCHDLHGLYVFEGNSLSAHLNQANRINFAPFGLSYLTTLAEVTDHVRSILRQLINEREQPHAFQPLFDGISEVSTLISSIGANTDIRGLESLAELTAEDEVMAQGLDKRVAELKVKNIPRQIQIRRQEITDLKNLKTLIESAISSLGEPAVADSFHLIEEFQLRREELAASGADQFRSDDFTQIGTSEWRAFIAATKALAEAESKGRQEYPAVGDHCLLCRQSLPEGALSLIRSLWAFLKSDSQARFDRARSVCETRIRDLERINVNYFSSDSNVRRLLQTEAPTLISAIDPQMQALATRKQEMIDFLRRREKGQLAPQIQVDLTDLQRLVSIREAEIEYLNNSDVGVELRKAEAALRLLRHRQTLCLQLPKIREYIDRRKWATIAERSLGSTRNITTKYNELFKELVTDRYTAKFTALMNKFGPDIRVAIEARGFKGETVRQIVLCRPAITHGFTVEHVLSDGEKKAAALADFLTEVTLDDSSSAIVFDDPITSLDNRWKEVFATCLAEEAKHRQVIVFTHDLGFLYHLKREAEVHALDVVSHWIRAESGNPGFVYANNSPICEKEYKSAKLAQDYYSRAISLPPGEQQSTLQQGFGALRTSYEALIVFEIFNEVVLRFEERISFGRLKDIRFDGPLLNDIIQHMEELSRHIEGHLHSDAMATTKPKPTDLLKEIEAFESIRKRSKDLRKQAKVTYSAPSPAFPAPEAGT